MTITVPALAATGDLKWQEDLGVTTQSSPTIAPNGLIYVGDDEGDVHVINPALSANRIVATWTVPGSGTRRVNGSATINKAGTRLFIGSANGQIYCLNITATAPTVVWTYTVRPNAQVHSTPALNCLDESEIYFTATDGYVYAVDAASGVQKWELNIGAGGGPYVASPAVGADGTIYAHGQNSHLLYALTSAGSTATVKWSVDLGEGSIGSASIGPDGTIYQAAGSSLMAVDPNGAVKWSFATGGTLKTTPVIDSKGNVFIGSDDFYLYSIKPDGTQLALPVPTSYYVCGSGAIAANGRVWIPSTDGSMYLLNSTGSLFAAYPVLAGITYSAPAIGSDGTVYFADVDGYLKAIEGQSSPIAPGFWPNWRMNNRHVADARNNRWTEGPVTSVTVTEIVSLYPGTCSPLDRGYPTAINDANMITGQTKGVANYGSQYAGCSERAFRYSGYFDLGSLNGYLGKSAGYALNPSGMVTGWAEYGSSTTIRAFRGNSSMTALPPLPGYPQSAGYGIAADGTVVGMSDDGAGTTRATKWPAGSTTPVDLGDLPSGSGNTWVYAVNHQGRIAGKAAMVPSDKVQAFVSSVAGLDQQPTELGSYAGSNFESEALALDGFGQVVGDTQISSTVTRPFLKRIPYSGAWIIPTMPTGLNGNWATARAINERGQIVGEAQLDNNSQSRAFIWIPYALNLKDLNDYLSTTQKNTWVLLAAWGINDQGRIVCLANKKEGSTWIKTIALLYPN